VRQPLSSSTAGVSDEQPGRTPMKITVDLNRCQCYAQCAFLAPNLFEIHGEEALMYIPVASQHERQRARRAVAACPVQAILLDDEEEGGAIDDE
jgi:ferredoxin